MTGDRLQYNQDRTLMRCTFVVIAITRCPNEEKIIKILVIRSNVKQCKNKKEPSQVWSILLQCAFNLGHTNSYSWFRVVTPQGARASLKSFNTPCTDSWYVLLTKREFERARHWSSSCLRIHGSKKTIIPTQKRTRRPISSHLDRTSWVNKGFISLQKRYRFLAEARRKMSKGKMGTSFRLSRVANQYTGFASYFRLADSAMLIILKIAWVPCCRGCIVCLFLSKQSRFLFAWSTFQHAV